MRRFLGGLMVIAMAMAALVTAPVSAQRPDPRPSAVVVDTVVADAVVSAVEDGAATVVIALEGAGSARPPSPGRVGRLQDGVVDALPRRGASRIRRFSNVPAMTMRVSSMQALDAVARQPGVLRVDLDLPIRPTLSSVVALTNADDRHQLANTGSGVRVAVLDTGVDSDHPDLVGDLLLSESACWVTAGTGCPNGSSFQTGLGAAEDAQGHGTRVAGIITSSGIVSAAGFAPDAEIIPIRVFDDNGSGFLSNAVAALDYLAGRPDLGVDIVNMSLGSLTTYAGHCDNNTAINLAMSSAVAALIDNGVLVVAAAGNSGATNGMSSPGCIEDVLSVAASSDVDTAASFSNISQTTDLFGPGVDVTSPAMGGGIATSSGTSMASPAVAGCAALLIEAGEATTPAQLSSRLRLEGAVSIVAANNQVYPRFDCQPVGFCGGLAATVVLAQGDVPTSGDDVIVGTPGPDFINGLGGNDRICAGAGDDTVYGGPGDDFIEGAAGDDTIFGGDGDDLLVGGAGDDVIQGNGGGDDVQGGPGSNALSGNDGNDALSSGAGDSTFFGGAGDDVMVLGTSVSQNVAQGGPGDDAIGGGGGVDIVAGNEGFDDLVGWGGDDTLYGGDQHDTIDGGAGDDTVLGGLGSDQIVGGVGDDRLSGNGGGDSIDGGEGADEIYGVDGSDTLGGGPGGDIILGGAGSDVIDGGGGADLMSGNEGSDTVSGGAGADEIYGADGFDTLFGGAGSDIVLGGAGDDTVYVADGTSDQVSGNAGNDWCQRDPGLDVVFECETLR